MNTNQKPDNSCFENNTDVCFLLGLVSVVGRPVFLNFLMAMKDARDFKKKSH